MLEQVTIIATPNPGYVFSSGWSDGTSAVEKIVTMNSDITIRANFEPFRIHLELILNNFKG